MPHLLLLFSFDAESIGNLYLIPQGHQSKIFGEAMRVKLVERFELKSRDNRGTFCNFDSFNELPRSLVPGDDILFQLVLWADRDEVIHAGNKPEIKIEYKVTNRFYRKKTKELSFEIDPFE